MAALRAITLLCALGLAAAQPFLPGQNVGPLGTWRTTDAGGPYNLTLLSTQANEVADGAAARGNFTDKDIIDFLANVECLEGLFDTWGAFGRGFNDNLELGGPTPIGAQKANISAEFLPFMQEVALNEQGHILLVRQAGGMNPCPAIDFTGGFNQWYAAAYNLTNRTIEQEFGRPFNPFENDATFITSVLSLEELGATGNKGLAGILINPVHANAVAGLATSATAQATVERMLLWRIRDQIVPPFGETVQQVFARVSALRDSLDGPTFHDQGLVNTDPRFIAVPDQGINMIPTDVRGLTLNRTPQQNINILTLGSANGVGVFFPEGLRGAIRVPGNFTATTRPALADFPSQVAAQAPASSVGNIAPPITGPQPDSVPGQTSLTQALGGNRTTSSYLTRGYYPVGEQQAYFNSAPASAPAASRATAVSG